jgi:HSP20 family protein
MNLIARHRDHQPTTALPLRVSRLFDGLLDSPWDDTQPTRQWLPAMDVMETPRAIEILLDLPGIDPESVDVSVQEDRVEISGGRDAVSPPTDARWYRFERPTGSFHRSLRLPVPVDADKAEARTRHGQLHVFLPKTEDAQPKRIQIKG